MSNTTWVVTSVGGVRNTKDQTHEVQASTIEEAVTQYLQQHWFDQFRHVEQWNVYVLQDQQWILVQVAIHFEPKFRFTLPA